MPSPPNDLRCNAALVTGATSGLGRAVATEALRFLTPSVLPDATLGQAYLAYAAARGRSA